jgi:hypothetical protein
MSLARRPVRWLALACYLLFGSLYLVRTPVFEGPDENGHYWYALHLCHAGSLPIVQKGHDLTGQPGWNEVSQGHHPPLYYLMLAGLMRGLGMGDTWPRWSLEGVPPGGPLKFRHGFDEAWPWSQEVRGFLVLRAFTLLLGLGSLLLAGRIAGVVFPGRAPLADATMLCLACLPQWAFAHAVLDNGALATLLAHAAVLALAGVANARALPAARAAGLGALLGAGLLSKLTMLALLPLAGLVVLWLLVAEPARRAQTLRGALLCAAVAAAISGWFFVRNERLYGEWLGMNAHALAYADSRVPDALLAQPARYWGYVLERLGISFLGSFGWNGVDVPRGLALGAWALVGVGLGGFALGRWLPGGGLRMHPPLLVVMVAIWLVVGSVLEFNRRYAQPQGRYAFAAAGPMVLVFCAGLTALGGAFLARLALAAAPVSSALVLGLVFWPAFAPATGSADRFEAVLHGGLRSPGLVVSGYKLASPADRARCEGPPAFEFSAPATERPDSRYSIHAWTGGGRIVFGVYELTSIPLLPGRLEFPAEPWQQLPIGEPIFWRVRRLPDRLRGERWQDMPSSEVRQLERVR